MTDDTIKVLVDNGFDSEEALCLASQKDLEDTGVKKGHAMVIKAKFKEGGDAGGSDGGGAGGAGGGAGVSGAFGAGSSA